MYELKENLHIFKVIIENLGLNSMEKQLLTNLLQNDAGIADRDPRSNSRLSWRQVGHVFIDWRIYIYGLIAVGNLVVIQCLTIFLPTLMENEGYDKTVVYLTTAPLYLVACLCCLLASYSSSCQNEHGYHVAFCLLVGLFGFISMLFLPNRGKIAIYLSSSVAFCGMLSAFPLLLSWLTNNIGGHTKRAIAISFAVSMAQISSVVTPHVKLLLLITCQNNL